MEMDELVQVFGINREPAMKRFFMDRHIPDTKIAEWIGDVTSMSVGRWLRDNKPIPEQYKPQMEAFRQAIMEWERIHGRLFNTFGNPPTRRV